MYQGKHAARDITDSDLIQPEWNEEDAIFALSDADAEYAMSLRDPLFREFLYGTN